MILVDNVDNVDNVGWEDGRNSATEKVEPEQLFY
jgi:hypothetical protein